LCIRLWGVVVVWLAAGCAEGSEPATNI